MFQVESSFLPGLPASAFFPALPGKQDTLLYPIPSMCLMFYQTFLARSSRWEARGTGTGPCIKMVVPTLPRTLRVPASSGVLASSGVWRSSVSPEPAQHQPRSLGAVCAPGGSSACPLTAQASKPAGPRLECEVHPSLPGTSEKEIMCKKRRRMSVSHGRVARVREGTTSSPAAPEFQPKPHIGEHPSKSPSGQNTGRRMPRELTRPPHPPAQKVRRGLGGREVGGFPPGGHASLPPGAGPTLPPNQVKGRSRRVSPRDGCDPQGGDTGRVTALLKTCVTMCGNPWPMATHQSRGGGRVTALG